uniref:Peptidase_M13 domain-containing protein n=2 Tax=Caenorhabditis japonica TaxID=281687 RepID=A0A8R1EEU8_CAEJA
MSRLRGSRILSILSGWLSSVDMPTLVKQFKISKSVIWATLNTPNRPKATGSPLKTSSGDDRIIVRMSKKNPRLTSTDINSELKDQYGVQDSVQGHCQQTSAPHWTLQKAPSEQANDSGEEPFSSTEVGKGHIGTGYLSSGMRYYGATSQKNYSDHLGITTAWIAYKELKDEKEDISIVGFEDYPPDKLFFHTRALKHCNSYNAREQQISEGYSVSDFRVNGVLANMEEFAETFQCPVGSPMNPEKRCKMF